MIPADYLQIRLGQRINLFVLNSKLKSNLKLQFVIPPFNFINIYTFLLLCLHSFDEGKTKRAPFNSTNIQQKEYIDFISDPVAALCYFKLSGTSPVHHLFHQQTRYLKLHKSRWWRHYCTPGCLYTLSTWVLWSLIRAV